MDPYISDLLSKVGEAARQTVQVIIKAWEKRKNRKLTATENKEIAQTARNIIQAATMDDVREYSPAYHRLSSAVKRVAAKKKVVKWVAYKKAAPKRGAVQTATRRLIGKKSAAKKRTPVR